MGNNIEIFISDTGLTPTAQSTLDIKATGYVKLHGGSILNPNATQLVGEPPVSVTSQINIEAAEILLDGYIPGKAVIDAADGHTISLTSKGNLTIKGDEAIKTNPNSKVINLIAGGNTEIQGLIRTNSALVTLAGENVTLGQIETSGTDASSGQVKVEAKNTIDFTKGVYLSSNATDADKNKWKSLQVGSKENRNKETIFRKGGSETTLLMKYAPLLKPYSTAAREAVDYSIHMGGMGSADVYSENITLENGAFIQDNNILTLSATDKVVIKKEASQLPLPTLYVNGNGTQNVEAKTIEVTADDTRPAFLVDYGGSGIFKASESATFTGDVVVYGGNLDFTTTAKTEIKGGGLAAYGAKSSLKWTGAQDTEFIVTNRAHDLVDTNLAVADALTLWAVSADLSNVKTTLLASPEAGVYSSYDKSKGAAARLLRGGSVTLKNATVEGTVISNGENASGEKSAFNVASGGSFQMKGDVLAGNGGTVNLVLDSAKSKLEGYIDSASDWERANFANEARQYTDDLSETIATESAGAVNLTLASGGVWTVKDWSTLNELTLNEGGVVDLTEKLGTFLYINELKGANGTFLLSMGEDAAKSTMLYVEKASASSQNVEISLDNVSNVMDLNGRRFASTNGETTDWLFKVTSQDQGFNDVEFEVRNEAYDKTNTAENAKYNASSSETKPGEAAVDSQFENGKNWYLYVGEKIKPSKTGEAILATARGTYWQSIDLDRLNKRMGDRRMTEGDNGLWVRLRHDRIGTNSESGNFRAKNTTYQVGYEHTWTGESGKRMAGIAIDYRDADIDYRAVDGDGSNNRVGLIGYYTWLGESGWYTDLVARYGRLKNDLKVVNTLGETVKGDYHNNLFGLSFEGGKKIVLGESAWFVEPQAQIQYLSVGSADYVTTQGTTVKMSNFDSFVSRVGFRLGHDFGAQSTQAYVKADWLHEWSGKQHMKVSDKTTPNGPSDVSLNNRGSWYDVGFGVQTLFGKNVYGYLDAEYQFGSALESSWALNTGIRWQF